MHGQTKAPDYRDCSCGLGRRDSTPMPAPKPEPTAWRLPRRIRHILNKNFGPVGFQRVFSSLFTSETIRFLQLVEMLRNHCIGVLILKPHGAVEDGMAISTFTTFDDLNVMHDKLIVECDGHISLELAGLIHFPYPHF